MKKIFIIALIFTISETFCQNNYNDGEIEIKYENAKKVSPKFHMGSSTKYASDDLEKLKVTFKIKSLNREWIDLNKISLLDRKNKIRYRPSDITFRPFTGNETYTKLLREDIKLKGYFGIKGFLDNYLADAFYKPEIKDSFGDYIFEGYSIFEMPYNFGNKKKPIMGYVYFKPHQYLKFSAQVYFPLKEKAENPILELYYGNEKISDIEI